MHPRIRETHSTYHRGTSWAGLPVEGGRAEQRRCPRGSSFSRRNSRAELSMRRCSSRANRSHHSASPGPEQKDRHSAETEVCFTLDHTPKGHTAHMREPADKLDSGVPTQLCFSFRSGLFNSLERRWYKPLVLAKLQKA